MMQSDVDAGSAFPVVVDVDHQFKFLPTGELALSELIACIERAQRSLCFEMYIFKSDRTGERVRNALEQAAQRGVHVQILLDAFGSSDLPKQFFDQLVRAGVQLKLFNPSRALRAAFRNHRKLCIADGETAVVGGFNIGDDYCGDGVNRGWRDLGMRIQGPVVAILAESFFRLFNAAHADSKAVIRFARGKRGLAKTLDVAAVYTTGPGFEGAALRRVLVRDFQRGNRVTIVSAYFTPPWRMRRALRHAAARGNVRILLPGKIDVATMRLAAQHLYERMLRHAVEIFEYQPQIMHAKLVVVDDIVYVGSSNFDTRSLQLNFDFLVRIPNRELAEQARAIFREMAAHSASVSLSAWRAQMGFWQSTLRFIAYWLATRFDPYIARRRWRMLR